MNESEARILRRVRHFLEKPFHEQSKSFYARWRRVFPRIPFPIRLPFGAWFIGRNDAVASLLASGQFENKEQRFVERFLKPNMIVLDVGAHQGLYSLLASKRVGPFGRVIAFEPSDRECKALLSNLRINRCKNVQVFGTAVSDHNGEALLHVVESHSTGCNSLRLPASDIGANTSPVMVRVVRLDDWLSTNPVGGIDFIKLDVEGAELSVLKGAERLLQQRPRPLLLVEIEEIRTAPWGYEAKQIIHLLESASYSWFGITPDGKVRPLDTSAPNFNGNFIACPEERFAALEPLRVTTP